MTATGQRMSFFEDTGDTVCRCRGGGGFVSRGAPGGTVTRLGVSVPGEGTAWTKLLFYHLKGIGN